MQEECARVLMFRGADKDLRNNTGHTAYQVAVAASYHSLAETIQQFTANDVGENLPRLLRRLSAVRCNVNTALGVSMPPGKFWTLPRLVF